MSDPTTTPATTTPATTTPAPEIDYARLAKAIAAQMPASSLVPAAAAPKVARNRPCSHFATAQAVYVGDDPDPMLAFVVRAYEHDGKTYYDAIAFRAGNAAPYALQSLTDADFASE